MRALLAALLLALAVPATAQQQLTFRWSPFSHPQFAEYAWALHMDGQAVQTGRTTATQVTVTVSANVAAAYHVNVSWLHRQNGKLTFIESTATQTVTGPDPPPVEPPPVEPPPVEPPPVTTDSARIGWLRPGQSLWSQIHWGDIHIDRQPGEQIQLHNCAYFWRSDGTIDYPPTCPAPPAPGTEPPPITPGPVDPPEWIKVDFAAPGEWYMWTTGGHAAHVSDGVLVVELAADTEGYAGASVAGVDLRGREVIAHVRSTPNRANTESWLVIDDGSRRYMMGRASGYQVSAVADAQGFTILRSGGWRADWDVAIRHEGGELLFRTIPHGGGNIVTRHRVPLDIDLSNVTISLMGGAQDAIRTSDVGVAEWTGLTVRPAQ